MTVDAKHSAPQSPATTPGEGRLSVVALLAAAATPLVLLAPMLMQRKLIPQDEGQLLAYPSLMVRGFQANTDFVYTYGIANLWTLKAAFLAFGESVIVERSVGLVARLVLVVFVSDLARRSAGRIAALAAGWSCVLLLAFEGTQAFAWVNALTIVTAAVWVAANVRPDRRRLAGAVPWLLAGLAISFRGDIAIAAIGAVALTQWCRAFRPDIRWAAGGLLLGTTPMWVHLLTADNVLSDTFIDPILNGGGRRLPLVPQDRVLAFSMLLLVVSLIVVGVVLWMTRSQRASPAYVSLLGLASVSILTFPQAIQRVDPTHFRYVGAVLIPAAISAAVFGYQSVKVQVTRRPVALGPIGLVSLGVFAGITLGLVPQLHYTALLTRATLTGNSAELSTEVGINGRVVPFEPDQATHLQRTLNAANAAYIPGSCDRIFVGPSDLRYALYGDTFIYFLLDRFTPASRYLEFNPGGANASDSTLAKDLTTADVVVLNRNWDDPASLDQPPGATPSEPGPSAPNDVIKRSFVEVRRFGPWQILLSKHCQEAARKG